MATTTVWYRTKNLAGAHGSSPSSITDETGNGQHATVSGATVTTSDSTYVGKSLTGTAMVVSIPTTSGGLWLVDGTYVEVKAPHQATFIGANLADGDASTLYSVLASQLPVTIQYRVRTGAGADTFTTATYNEYTVKNGGTAANSPTAWTFQASNNPAGGWTTLHTVTGATTTANTATTHSFSNSTAYEYYKWVITAVNGGTSVEWYQATPTGLSTGKQQYDGSIFIVVKRSATDSTSAWRLGTSGQQSHWTFSGTAYDDTGTTVRRSFTPSLAVTSHRIVEFRVTGTTYQAFIDNVSQLSASSVTKGWELWQPAVFVSYNGTWTEFKAIKYGSADTPATVAGAEYTALYNEHMAAPPVTASAISAGSVMATAEVGHETTASVTSTAAVTASTATNIDATATVTSTAAVTATGATVTNLDTTASVTSAAAVTATGVAAAGGEYSQTSTVTSAASVTATGVVAAEIRTTVARAYAPSGARALVPLVAVAPLAGDLAIERKSVVMHALSDTHPMHDRINCAEGDNTIVTEIIGYVQLWINGVNATHVKDKPTVIRRWESEVPIGDTAAAFEFPMLDPWTADGSTGLEFLVKDAPVHVGIVDTEGNTRRVWSGFLDARGNGLGEGEDYQREAKGTLWAALHTIREPVPFTTPTDIGVLIARCLNSVVSKRWADMPETPIGIPTLTRGSRDQRHWEYVQELLSEAWTDDGRQWTLIEAAPEVFALQLKPGPSTVDATVAYGTPGVEIDLRVDESTRVDGIFARAIGPDGGGWANIFYPGLELINPPPYPNSDAGENVGPTDGDTDSGTGVTDWQTRVVEIGTFDTPAISGTFSAAWNDVVEEVQASLGITVDGSVGPQTWNATFDRGGEGIDLTPLRLPLAMKNWVWPTLHTATGVISGPNPNYTGTASVPRFIPLDLGPKKTKTQGRKIARNVLTVYGEAEAFGTATWEGDPNETDRTRLTHLSNVKVLGHEGEDRVLQVSRKVVELEATEDGPVYVVTTTLDQRARDAMAVEDLLAQRLSAQTDPSRRPGNPAKSSRQVADQRTPWDSESPCGVVRRTAVNGDSGLWSIITLPFAEVGKLASIRLHGTQRFAHAIFASLRITENDLASIVGDPLASSDPWRANKDALDEFGIIEAWGEQGQACGYSPGTETDGYAFTGDFILDTPVDYWTETPPYVSWAFFFAASGFVSGRGIPAYEGA